LSITEFANKIEINNQNSLTHLNISGNFLEDKGLIALASAIEKNMTKLTLINISDGNVGKKGIEALLNCLNNSHELCNGLTNLDISHNRLDNESSRLLGLFLGKTTSLIELNISSTSPSMVDICGRLEKCAPLKKLDMSKIKVPKQDIELIFHFIHILPLIEEVNLSNSGINFEAMNRLITTNTTITYLNVSE